MSVNKSIILGNLCADPEVRVFSNGGKVCNLRVATNERWKTKEGEKKERVEYHNISIYNEGLAGVAEKYLRKGSKVYLEGKLQTRKWQDQSGNDRYSTEVVLQGFDAKMEMLDPPKQGGQQNDGWGGQASSDQSSQDLDDDVPFITCDYRHENKRREVL